MIKLRWEEDISPLWEDDTLERVAGLLDKKYRAFLKAEHFEIEGGRTSDAVQIRTTLAKNDGSVNYPVEAVLPLDPEQESEPDELALLLIDYLDVYWNEYLTGGRETFLPIDWSRHECEGEEFFLRGAVRNLSLEAQADALFRQHGTGGYDITDISSDT